MTDHDEAAARHLEAALAEAEAAGPDGPSGPWLHLGAAGVHAVLHLAETLRHGLRDLVYELRD